MKFDEWWENYIKDCLGHTAQYPTREQRQAADDAFHHRQSLIDAHNRRCEEKCNKIEDITNSCDFCFDFSGDMCPVCPRRHKIEDQ